MSLYSETVDREPPKKTVFSRLMRMARIFFCTIGLLFFSAVALRIYVLLRARPAVEFKDETYLRLNFDTALYESRPDDLIGSLTFGNPPTLYDVISGINRAAENPKIKALIAFSTNPALSLTQIQEIREAVLAFRKTGKDTVFYAPTLGEMGGGLGMYYLASAFGDIRIQPSGEVGVAGISIESPYLKDALLKIGIRPSFNARYEYKTGADMMNASEMSPQERETMTGIMDAFISRIAHDAGEARGIEAAEMKQILLNGPYFADKALEMRLIDRIEYTDNLEEELKEKSGELVDFFDFAYASEPEIKHKTPVVAFIPAVGIIQFGDSVFGGDAYRSILGLSTFSENMRQAADDDSVKAIVIRIDSPGGGYISSDAMRNEIEFVKKVKEKPVVCSMGSSAASGGYFISLGCDAVFAMPATLTGSIGVFGGKLVFKNLLDKFDVNVSSIKMGKNAGMFSPVQDFTVSQKQYFNDSLDRVYQDFTAKVAERRLLSAKETDAAARGRVFTGQQAVEKKLIDGIGGITASVAAASKLAGQEKPLPVLEFPAQPTRVEMLISLLNSDTLNIKDRHSRIKGVVPAVQSLADRLTSGDFRLFYNGIRPL